MNKIKINYFSDILCIWAYLAQIRIDELSTQYGSRINIENHFIPVFGSVGTKMKTNWASKGGVAAYSEHTKNIAAKFSHISIHPDIWRENTPTTSTSAHLFLKSIQLLQTQGELSDLSTLDDNGKSVFETCIWAFRLAFFKDLIDISSYNNQMAIAERLGLPTHKIEHLIQSGAVFAALDDDLQLKEKYGVSISPSIILNEGRQRINGNVGFKVIEANVHELLNQPETQASWC